MELPIRLQREVIAMEIRKIVLIKRKVRLIRTLVIMENEKFMFIVEKFDDSVFVIY